MKASWMGVMAGVLLLAAGPALSQSAKPYEGMEVTGSIVVNPDGRVAAYTLDKPDKLPPAAVQVLSRNVPWWRFKPVVRNGKPVRFTSRMSVRLVATPAPNDTYSIGVAGAYFWSQGATQPPDGVAGAKGANRNKPPRYPHAAKREHVSGVVYLVMQLDRRGRVRRVAAQQVNLFAPAPTWAMAHWQHVLAEASINAAKRWTFEGVDKGERAADGYWYVRKPVRFTLIECGTGACGPHGLSLRYGMWQPYIPGPKQVIPWLDPQLVASGSADAMPADGGIYPMRQSLQLVTALSSGG